MLLFLPESNLELHGLTSDIRKRDADLKLFNFLIVLSKWASKAEVLFYCVTKEKDSATSSHHTALSLNLFSFSQMSLQKFNEAVRSNFSGSKVCASSFFSDLKTSEGFVSNS